LPSIDKNDFRNSAKQEKEQERLLAISPSETKEKCSVSKLDGLIQQYCPNGVEYRTVLSVLSQPITDGPHETPVLCSSGIPFISVESIHDGIVDVEKCRGYISEDSSRIYRQKYTPQKDDVYMVKSASVGRVAIVSDNTNFDIWSPIAAMRANKSVIMPRYLFYSLQTETIQKLVLKKSSKGSQPNLSMRKLEEFLIPVPPLPVQQEIVRILDKFTELEAELEAELLLRRRQYEYYRDTLLNLEDVDPNSWLGEMLDQYCPDGVQWKMLGEVFDTCTDYTAAGSFADIAKNVIYRKMPDDALLVRTMDIKNGFTKENMVYIDNHAYNYLWRVHIDKPCIIMPNIGNCGEVYHVLPENIPYKKAALAPNAILLNSSTVNLRYLFHVLQSESFQKKLRKIVTPVGQTKFNKTEFKDLTAPIPPIPVQEAIVSVLDKFSALCTNISAGLPAEIAARHKQYEYYRDKLLNFDHIV